MRKFTQSILGKGVTFTQLEKFRDKKGRIDFNRVEIDGVIIENDGYVCTIRGWDGTIYENVETCELTPWPTPRVPHGLDMPCTD